MKQPIKQAIVAGAMGMTIIVTGMVLVSAGRADEQAAMQEAAIAETTTTTTTTTTTKPKKSVYYYDSVPLDKDLQNYIIRECKQKGIDPAVVMAMIDRESDYDINTVGDNGNSFGLCQIQPKWHYKRMMRLGCTDLFDPYQNVTVCIDYLCELLSKYDGDMAKALVGYNQGSYKGTVTEYAKAVMENAERIGDLNAVDE
jgi:soluble lytic murein transglycosylase-like protein